MKYNCRVCGVEVVYPGNHTCAKSNLADLAQREAELAEKEAAFAKKMAAEKEIAAELAEKEAEKEAKLAALKAQQQAAKV